MSGNLNLDGILARAKCHCLDQNWNQKAQQKYDCQISKVSLFVFGRWWNSFFINVLDPLKLLRIFYQTERVISNYFPEFDSYFESWIANSTNFKIENCLCVRWTGRIDRGLLKFVSNALKFQNKAWLPVFCVMHCKVFQNFTWGKKKKKMLLPFETTHLCDYGFSILTNLKIKYKKRLNSEDSIQIAFALKRPNFDIVLNLKPHFSKTWSQNVFN